MKTYKDVNKHNNTSGNETRHWAYLSLINRILSKKPEISPVVTCSASKGIITTETLNSCLETKLVYNS